MSHMSHPPPVPDNNLTDEEHEKLKPLLKLASLGRQDLSQLHTPPEQRRAQLKTEFLGHLRIAGTISKAAAKTGLSRRTVQRWQNDDTDFAAEVKKWLHEDQADELHDTLFEIAIAGKRDPKMANAAVRAAEFLLKSLDRETYGDQLKTEVNQTVNHIVQMSQEVRDTFRQRQLEKVRQIRTIDMPSVDGKENEE